MEAALYDEMTPAGEASPFKPVGTLLPKWEDIRDDPEVDLRELLEPKKIHKEEASTSKNQPQCVLFNYIMGALFIDYEGARGLIVPNRKATSRERVLHSPHVM